MISFKNSVVYVVMGWIKNNLFRKKKRAKDYLLALDIGTEFVKAVIFKKEEDFFGNQEEKRGIVVGVGRERQPLGYMLAGAVANIEGVSLTCQQAIKQASQLAGVRPTKAVIGVAGEFIKGATTNFIEQREKPEKEIDLVELKNIIQKAQWKAFNQIRSQLAWETGRSEVEIRLVNALITEIRIDDYQVTNPLNFQGKEIFLSIFNVYAPLVHLRALESIAPKLNLELLSVAAEPYALTKLSGFNSKAGAIFIDIGGGTTDIALARQKRIEGIKSFALAGRSFTKRLAQVLGLNFAEAEEVKIRYAQNQLGRSVRGKIRQILKRDIEIWLNGIELTLEEFGQTEYFPSTILLCGGGSLLPGIKSILKKKVVGDQWLSKFPFSQIPQVNFISLDQIKDITDPTDSLKGPESVTPLALAGLTLEISTDEKEILPPILRRVARIMR